MYQDDVETGGKNGRGDEQKRTGARRGLFVDQGPVFGDPLGFLTFWFGVGTQAGLWARLLVSFCPFWSPGGVRVGAYKAGWEGGRWGQRRPGLGEGMALRDARSRWPGRASARQ